MGADFMAVLSGLQKKGGGGADFGKIKPGANLLRLYRHESWAEGQIFYPRTSHWPFGGQQTPCTGEGCDKCVQVQKLFAAGDKQSRDTAYQHRAQTRGIFAAVDVTEPSTINVLELPEGTTKSVMAAIASAGGWTGEFPKSDPTSEQGQAQMKEFFEALKEGTKVAMGSQGYDIGITYKPKEGKKRAEYVVQLLPKTVKTKTLAFEQTDVPDIAEIMQRIDAKKAEKGA